MPLTGKVLGGRYLVGAQLGRGGMGTVYEAVQQGLERTVALKIIHTEFAHDPVIRARFQREARAVARLRHPNVVQISDYVEVEGEPPFLVMERLHGETLRDVLNRAPQLPARRVARIGLQVLSALDAAHRAKIVHRDLKPENIFLERTTAQSDIVKVLDFGVAKFIGEEDQANKLTRQGLAVGTPAFMAPEQAMGDAVDGRADLYALGATMYIALTGKKPISALNMADLVQALMTEVPTPAKALRPDLDERFSRLVARALEKNPNARFANAMAMSEALTPFTTKDAASPRAHEPTLKSAEGFVHDTVPDPPHAPRQVQHRPPSSTNNNAPLAIAIAASIAGSGIAFATAYLATATPTPTPTPTLTLTPTQTPPPSPTPKPTITADPTTPSPIATTPAVDPLGPNEPAECNMARQANRAGARRQAAQMAARCVQKGGDPPF